MILSHIRSEVLKTEARPKKRLEEVKEKLSQRGEVTGPPRWETLEIKRGLFP